MTDKQTSDSNDRRVHFSLTWHGQEGREEEERAAFSERLGFELRKGPFPALAAEATKTGSAEWTDDDSLELLRSKIGERLGAGRVTRTDRYKDDPTYCKDVNGNCYECHNHELYVNNEKVEIDGEHGPIPLLGKHCHQSTYCPANPPKCVTYH